MFPESNLLEFIAADIPFQLPWAQSGNKFVVFSTDHYSKLPRSIRTPYVSSTHVTHIPLNDSVIPYGIRCSIRSENIQQFFNELFNSLCSYLCPKKLETTVYSVQTDGKKESYNRTLLSKLRLYVAENQCSCAIFVHTSTYAYSFQPYCSTSISHFPLRLRDTHRAHQQMTFLVYFQQLF